MNRLTARSYLLFAVLTALFLAGHSIIRQTVTLALSNGEYTHILLVVPIVVAFVLLDRLPETHVDRVDRVLSLVAALAAILAVWSAHFANDASVELSLKTL